MKFSFVRTFSFDIFFDIVIQLIHTQSIREVTDIEFIKPEFVQYKCGKNSTKCLKTNFEFRT